MFDLTSTKLLLLGIVALVVIGPKDLPVLLRTLGKYMGIIKRQAAEFRSQFEEAMRESELEELKKEVEGLKANAESSMRDAERSVTSELDAARKQVEEATDGALVDKPQELAAGGLENAPASDAEQPALNGADHTDAASGVKPEPDRVEHKPDPERAEHKSGA